MRHVRSITLGLLVSVFAILVARPGIYGQDAKAKTWENAKVGQLIIKLTSDSMSETDKGEWAKPEPKNFENIESKRRLLMAQGLARPGFNKKVEDEKAVIMVIWLVREDLKTWPTKDGTFDKETINIIGTEIFLRPGTKWFETFDLKLTGKPGDGGRIKGRVSGTLGSDTRALKIKDATYELKPILDSADRELID